MTRRLDVPRKRERRNLALRLYDHAVMKIGSACPPLRRPPSASAAALIAALVVAGCGTATGQAAQTTAAPIAPVLSAQTSSPTMAAGASPTTRQISGRIVDENGTPISGATVRIPDPALSISGSVVTDSNGSYRTSVTVLPPPMHTFGTSLKITKTGYEDTNGWAAGTSDTTQDFRLYRIMNLTAGESLQLAITSDNSLCGLEDEFRCRAVHVLVPSSGTLVVDTLAADPVNTFWIIVGGPGDVQYPFAGVTHLSRSMAAGSTAVIQIMRPWQIATRQEFTLRTRLAP